jgi:mono/diheme cytochrome c family protein
MRWIDAALAVALVVALAGCDWFSTMSDPASIEPHERMPLLAAEHAVPLGGVPEFDLTNVDARVSNPQPSSPASLERGRAYFDTFCAICHGRTGQGDGRLTRPSAEPSAESVPLFPAIPSLATERVAGYTDAYVFGVISKGRGLMPEYSRVPVLARWDIVNYLRTMAPAPAATGTEAPGAQTAAPSAGGQ